MSLRCQSEPPVGERRGTFEKCEWTCEATEGNGECRKYFRTDATVKGQGICLYPDEYNFGWHRESYRPIWGEIWLFLFA